MAHRLLLIEPACERGEQSLASLLAAESSFRVDQTSWDAGRVESWLQSPARLVVAVVRAPQSQAVSFFDALRRQPRAIPTFAILSESLDAQFLGGAVEAADDFAFSPVHAQELRHRVMRLLGPEQEELDSVRRRLADEMGLAQLVGHDPAFTRIIEQLPRIAGSDAPVLITGETGTGKELCARAIHHLSKRRNFPFIALDCAAVPDHLFENEFFGHARGAFTDAHRDQKGLVAMAEGGTLFLDEVDALSPPAQVKLLRFLQERTFRPLGADRFERADVNVIAATNRDLESCVRDKQFRSDLYFRLNVLRLHLPPLRERRSDIALLAWHFLEALRQPDGASRKSFSATALRKLVLCDWPGNVRELSNIVQRAVVLAESTQILPCHVSLPNGAPSAESPGGSFQAARAVAIENFERVYVEDLLHKHNGNVTRAAREAGKDRRAFGRLVKRYGINRRTV
jgi:DNA-binding NtrC family response regulator